MAFLSASIALVYWCVAVWALSAYVCQLGWRGFFLTVWALVLLPVLLGVWLFCVIRHYRMTVNF